MNNLNFYYYFVAGIFLFGIVFYNWLKQKDYKKILSKFNNKDILLKTYGVKYFGKESEKGKPINSEGLMILLNQGLYYVGSFDKKEIFIPKGKIYSIAITDHHKGEFLERLCLAFYFENENGEIDRAAFSIPHPEIWVKGIKENLVLNNFFSIKREVLNDESSY